MNIFVYAVEKNPNAIITLKNLLINEKYQGKLEIVEADMRFWEPKLKAHIIVSELLGSFGDNELSPECLEGAQRYLRKGWIFIPNKYTSYAQIISFSKVWTEFKHCSGVLNCESPFVVNIQSFQKLTKTIPVFEFIHPNEEKQSEKVKGARLEFIAETDGIMHGFLGSFDCILYKDIMMSIRPENYTKDLNSWLPIVFPFKVI